MVFNPRRPYPSNDHPLPVQRKPNDIGFIPTLRGKIAQLKREVQGLEDRLRYRYGDDTGVPHAYKGEVTFQPGTDAYDIDIGTDVNIVVPDGRLHSVPIVMEGPGVFMARYFTVTMYQFLNGSTSLRYPIPFGKSVFGDAIVTRKFSYPVFPSVPNLYDEDRDVGVCFFWNLIDRDSERRLADQLIPHQNLLPQSFETQADGNLFEFEVPWLFERAGLLEFEFQLTTPILQPVNTLQPVLVRAEIHGTKFITERDMLLREAV